jgi:hypothetical protein
LPDTDDERIGAAECNSFDEVELLGRVLNWFEAAGKVATLRLQLASCSVRT